MHESTIVLILSGGVGGVACILAAYLYKAKVELLRSYEKLKENYKTLYEEKKDLELRYAVLDARYSNEVQSSQEKLEVLQNAKDQLAKEFSNLSNKIFEEKSKLFSASSQQQLELLLQPFREQIAHFSQEAREQFEEELKDRHLLKDELKRL